MRNVLIVAYYFPPLGGIGSVRVASFARDLEAFGWRATVLAPANGSYHRDSDFTFAEERVVRTRSLELSRVAKTTFRSGGDDVTPAPDRGMNTVLRKVARRYVYYPDAQIGWYPFALTSGIRAIREHDVDLVFSSANPVTAHLVARRLARMKAIPWVAEYRDPFSDMAPVDGPARSRMARLERSLARDAAALVMPSPTWAQNYGKRWGREIDVITNGCDGAISAAPSPEQPVLTHLGSMFPERHDLRGLWSAMRALADESQPVTLKFIGRLRNEVRDEMRTFGLEDLIEETGFLPHGEVEGAMVSSSALLIAGHAEPSDLLQGWIPSKLFEYLSTDLPIVYIGSPTSDAASILRGFPGCYVLDSGDVEGIVAALRSSQGQRYRRDVSNISRPALAGRLAAVFDRAVEPSESV